MPYVVPFDGSPLSEAALMKARIHQIGFDELPPAVQELTNREKPYVVTAICVIPDNKRYARRKGWIQDKEPYAIETVIDHLRTKVCDVNPDAHFEYTVVDEPGAGIISSKLRTMARTLNASTVFIGSEDAGRLVAPVTSVGNRVIADGAYDVTIVRRPLSDELEAHLETHPEITA